MKTLASLVAATLAFSMAAGDLLAGPLNLRFACERKRFDVERSTTASDHEIKEELWGYKVRISNSTFADQANLKVEYILFGEEDIPGTKESKELINRGTVEIANFLKNSNYDFQTEALKTSNYQLGTNWKWASGAPNKSRGRLRGIWIRVYQNDAVVAEHSTPTDFTKRDWNSPIKAKN